MKALVTGGLGFIGSNISEHLVRENHEVYIIDNLHTGSEENISPIKGKIRLLKANSGDLSKFNGRFDVIFHQGVYSSSPMYKENPVLVAKALEDWIKILEYARKNNTKIVFASTSSLYNGLKPLHHEDMPVPVVDFYSEARYAMERMAKLYDSLYGVQSVGLRYFSIYGPNEKSKGKYANLVSQFFWDIKANRQPLIFGDGMQKRDFVYVEDVVRANMLASRYPKSDIFNVGTGKNQTLNDVVSLLNRKLGTSISARYEQNKIKNYVVETLADTKKARSLLGFEAKITLEEGIDRLIRSYG